MEMSLSKLWETVKAGKGNELRREDVFLCTTLRCVCVVSHVG